jgi:histidyl-tRNA synthetase
MKIEPVKGTRDFYPELMFIEDYIFNVWTRIAKRFGYENFDGPMLEPAQLWQLKSGAEIPEQMYTLDDKGGRKLAIRPELTPTLARMIAEKQKSLSKPIRWYSVARCWRYEQPQSGRLREFFQFNLDCLGSDSMQLDAEVIATAIEIVRAFGLDNKDFYIRLGNRKLIESLILSSGVKKEQLKDVSRLIDKLDKIGEDNFVLSLKDISIDGKTITNLVKMLKISDVNKITEKSLDESGKTGLKDIKDLIKYIKAYGLEKYVQFDPSIMRGFDYYTSTVFEVFDRSKKYRAVAGGGRYDNLVADFGGEPLAGVGYGMGDVVLGLFLKERGKVPEYKKDIDYFVAVLDDKCLDYALKVAAKLRAKSNVEVELLGRKLGKQFEYADRIKAPKVVIVGDEEVKSDSVKIKDLKSGKEEKIKFDKL